MGIMMGLFDRMALFGTLTQQQKEHLLLVTLYNDLRLIEDDQVARSNRIKLLFSSEKNSISKKFGNLRIDLRITKDNWCEQISKANEVLLNVSGTKPFERAFALNTWLIRSGLCPLVHFAFDQWYEFGVPSETERPIIESVADMSTTYLYRLIPVSESFVTNQKIGDGAYSNVYRSNNGKTIYKVPKNLAALCFASHDEYVASLFAAETGLAPFLPKLISYDPRFGIIQREYIEGPTGSDMLKGQSGPDVVRELDQIETIYRVASGIFHETGTNFDIHPGNMIWSEKRNRWFLVDLGLMPKIGAEYFPREHFRDYFQKIWLDRHRLMKDVPIRSLDIKMGGIGALKIPFPV
jgi:hypothetical protein